MCKKHSSVNLKLSNGVTIRLDPCMKKLIVLLRKHLGWETLACCCGHGVYPKTIVISRGNKILALSPDKRSKLLRMRRFYKRDGFGRFYLPEISTPNNTIKIENCGLLLDLGEAFIMKQKVGDIV